MRRVGSGRAVPFESLRRRRLVVPLVAVPLVAAVVGSSARAVSSGGGATATGLADGFAAFVLASAFATCLVAAFRSAFPLPFFWPFATWLLLAVCDRECTRAGVSAARLTPLRFAARPRLPRPSLAPPTRPRPPGPSLAPPTRPGPPAVRP